MIYFSQRGEQVKGKSALNKHFSDLNVSFLFVILLISLDTPIFSSQVWPCGMPVQLVRLRGRACPEFLPENRAWGTAGLQNRPKTRGFDGKLRQDHPKIWVNYNDLTATSLESWLVRGNHPQMALIQALLLAGGGRPKGRSVALIQVSEIL